MANDEVLQYILSAQSFNEVDIAFIMHTMFKGVYKTDSLGQWYSMKDGSWILRNIFDIRELIGSAVCNMAISCVNLIKRNPDLYKMDINIKEKYDIILNNLAEKRQMLRDNNRIDEECIIKQHIKRIIEYRDNIKYNKINFNTFDTMTIVRSVHTRAFVDRVMEEVAGLFIEAE